MSNIATTKLSSKGQIVIPEEVRKELGLQPGAQVVVMDEGDVVILKKIEAPDRREFLALARKVRGQARKVGMIQSGDGASSMVGSGGMQRSHPK